MEENNNVELTEVNEEKATDVSTVTENEVDSYEDDEESGSTALGFAIGIAVAAVGIGTAKLVKWIKKKKNSKKTEEVDVTDDADFVDSEVIEPEKESEK